MARQRDPFSILKMKDVFDDCSETLLAAIKKQNPDINADSFDMALRQVVMNFGSALAYGQLNGVIASIQDAKPQYIEAADMLILARNEFTKGNHEEALKLFILSQDADDVDELFDAMALNNAKSELGENEETPVQADESDENEDEDESSDDEDWEDTPLYNLADPDQENDGDNDSDDSSDDSDEDDSDEDDSEDDSDEDEVMAKVRLVAKTIRVKADSDNDDEDESDQDENSEPEEDTVEAKLRLTRIAANKVSMDGTDKSRARASQLMKRAS
jgi:hypothetical protein